jgi:ribosomal protein L29
MKKEDKKELKSKTREELIKELRDARAFAARLTIDMASGKVENTNALYKKKKDIARILTFLSQKQFMEKSENTNKEERISTKA